MMVDHGEDSNEAFLHALVKTDQPSLAGGENVVDIINKPPEPEEPADESNQTAADAKDSVSADQERQILLLMLLAQVCALHDPTPKAFVIHVIELFERGILDRDSIHFLFELGLVPPVSPTKGLLMDAPSSGQDHHDTMAALTRTGRRLTLEQQRAQEAAILRAKLQQYVGVHHNDNGDTTCNKPWDAENFPLSLSRYKRDFTEVALLNAGSFGQVFQATRNLDGCDYAIKKVCFDATGYSNATIKQVVREIECLAKASDHPNVVRYFTSWLEASWAHGSSRVSTQVPSSNKMLPAIQHIMNSVHDDEPDGLEGSSYFSEAYSSYGQDKRFSFESSADSWEESIKEVFVNQFDDMGLGRREDPEFAAPNTRRNSSAVAPSYRYQICMYIQMQLCHQSSLADWIKARNRVIPEAAHDRRVATAVDVFKQIVNGLDHVHANGIVHRDLKPANIFASLDGRVIKIGDFGLSKQLMNHVEGGNVVASPPRTSGQTSFGSTVAPGDEHHALWIGLNEAMDSNEKSNPASSTPQTKLQPVDPLTAGIGTVSYAAPEQVSGRTYGTSADVFSLGLILLELMSCFETEHERLDNFRKCREQKLGQWLPDHYPEIAGLILECTSKTPSFRPSTKDLIRRLASLDLFVPSSREKELESELVKKELQIADFKMELAEKDETIAKLTAQLAQLPPS